MSITHPKHTPKEARSSIMRCFNAGLVPFLQSSPGLGKSSLIRSIAEEYNLKLIDVRLSQQAPEDLLGLPMKNAEGRAEFTPFTTFPLQELDQIPPGYKGWLLFFDEFNGASKATQMAAYKILLDRMVGNYALHQNVFMAAAGNLSTDKAIVNQLSTATQSRVIHLLMEVSKPEWVEWAYQNNIDHRIIGFIEFQPSKLHLFQPDHQDMTFPCPRTWEFTSRLIKDTADLTPLTTLLAGAISFAASVEFVTFSREYGKIPTIDQIVADPLRTQVPAELSTRFAVITMTAAYADHSNVEEILKYITRFRPDEQMIFLRSAFARDQSLSSIQKIQTEIVRIMRFVNGV